MRIEANIIAGIGAHPNIVQLLGVTSDFTGTPSPAALSTIYTRALALKFSDHPPQRRPPSARRPADSPTPAARAGSAHHGAGTHRRVLPAQEAADGGPPRRAPVDEARPHRRGPPPRPPHRPPGPALPGARCILPGSPRVARAAPARPSRWDIRVGPSVVGPLSVSSVLPRAAHDGGFGLRGTDPIPQRRPV